MTELEQKVAAHIITHILSSSSTGDIVSLVDAYGSLKRICAYQGCESKLGDWAALRLLKSAPEEMASEPVSEKKETAEPAASVDAPAPRRRGRPPATPAAATPAPAPEPEPLSEPHPPEPEAPAVDLDIVGSETPVYTIDDLRAVALASRQALVDKGQSKDLFTVPAQQILLEFGAKVIPDLKEEHIHEVVERFLKLEHVADKEAIAEQRKTIVGSK